jgi:hypothetical protein
MAAFASGGRRRSEIAGLRLEQLRDDPPVLSDTADPASTPLPCLSIRLGRTKTTEADDDAKALMIGPPAAALKAWMARAKIARGPVFRAIDRWGTLEERALSPQSVNLIVKRRVGSAGILGPWAALGLSHRGGPPGRLAAGSHAAVPAPICATGGQLLQRRRAHEGQGGKAGDLSARGVTRVAPGLPVTMVAGFRYHSLGDCPARQSAVPYWRNLASSQDFADRTCSG